MNFGPTAHHVQTSLVLDVSQGSSDNHSNLSIQNSVRTTINTRALNYAGNFYRIFTPFLTSWCLNPTYPFKTRANATSSRKSLLILPTPLPLNPPGLRNLFYPELSKVLYSYLLFHLIHSTLI